ncbi:3-deoxy-manno-octulosonate cytidylyltransferase [Prevotella sp.]|uniref:3-deoxy-manno-octulosonate cytidylyltransferase n=1 Tax=Prevotella sp. TaxID=59823 RepID=UPI003AB5F843
MDFVGIIPARYASTRFPGKPLAKLGGKIVIQRVYEQVRSVLDDVYVATDDERIMNAVKSFGGNAVMTSPNHKSGTDRIEEAVNIIGKNFDVVINIQGDEPFIHKSQIETICKCFDDPQTMIATLGRPFSEKDTIKDLENPNSPKLICDNNGFAMYFSRSIIPYIRGEEKSNWINKFNYLKHIGLYAYRANVLREITKLPQSSLELAESLEQLRWLQNGYRIKVGITNIETIGIDTPEDLEKAEEIINSQKI